MQSPFDNPKTHFTEFVLTCERIRIVGITKSWSTGHDYSLGDIESESFNLDNSMV